MNNQLDAVLFDLDGVLIDSYMAWYNLLNAAARLNGYSDIDKDKYDLLFGQSVEADVKILFPGMKPEYLGKFFEDHFFDYLDSFHILEGAIETLNVVKALGLKSSIVTNTSSKLAKEIANYLKLDTTIIVGNGDVDKDKPAPDMLFKAMKELDVAPENCLMVGDSDFDSRAAASASVHFVGFKRDGDFSVESHEKLQNYLRSIVSPER